MKVASESNTCAPARVDKDKSLLQQKNKQCSLKMKRLHNPKSFFFTKCQSTAGAMVAGNNHNPIRYGKQKTFKYLLEKKQKMRQLVNIKI
jgi:hypothetical protein